MNDQMNRKKAAAEATKNLAQLQKIDIAASKIVEKIAFAALYDFDPSKNIWDKASVEGTLFIYRRADRPFYSFVICNRNDPKDYIEPLTTRHIINADGNFLMFHRDDIVRALWFGTTENCELAAKTIQKIIDKLKASTTEGTLDAASKASASSSSAPNQPIDLLQMIKSANKNSVQKQAAAAPAPPPQPVAPPPEFLANLLAPGQVKPVKQEPSPPETVSAMPHLLAKLMVQEHSRSVLKEPGTAISADELEKDLLRTAKPTRHHLLQDFANSPSAISLAAISTKSVHGSEGDLDGDVAEGEVLEPLDTSFIVGSGSQTPSLNKEQFLSAITHLMATDDEFVMQIHQAYIDALNRRHNL